MTVKTIYRFFSYFLVLLLILLACTKSVTVFTEVEFELLEQRESDGFVNQGLATTFTIVPEAELEGYEYRLVYEVMEGSGYFENTEGERLESGKGFLLEPYSASLLFYGTEKGVHTLKITGSDNFGISEEIEIAYTLTDVPINWSADSSVAQLELGKEEPITLVLGPATTDVATTYEANYAISEGSGAVSPAEAEGYAPNTSFTDILPGSYPLLLVAEALGPLEIVFNLIDANGQELQTALQFEVVQTIPVISIDLGEHDELDMEVGGTIDCPVTYNPENATDQEIIWSSSDPDIVTVNEQGVFTAVAIGTAIITATAASNPDAEDQVTVRVVEAAGIPVTGISVAEEDPASTSNVRQLIATVTPDDASEPRVGWFSENEDIATVDADGQVTALSAGTVTIIVSSLSNPEVNTEIALVFTEESLQNGTDILAFSLPVQNGANLDADTHTITVNVADGTALNVSPATFSLSPGATSTPTGTEEQDFNGAVEYVVVAGNGDSQLWTVNVTVSPSGESAENEITTFRIPGQQGASIIDNNAGTIDISVPDGTVLEVVPDQVVVSDAAVISPSADALQDFSTEVVYTVTAENGDERIWTVTTTVLAPTGSNANDITAFSLPVQNSTSINTADHTITVNVTDGTDLNVAPANLLISPAASIAPNPAVVQDFSSSVLYTVTAENGLQQQWNINVTVSPPTGSAENDITAFELPGQNSSSVDVDTHIVTVNVPDGTNLNVAPAVLSISTGAAVTPSGQQVQDFNTAVDYLVTAENGTEQNWTVNVTVAANRPPVAANDVLGAQQGVATLLDVLNNDNDPDTPTSELVITAIGGITPNNAGTAVIEGNQIRFTSSGTFVGNAEFTYTINDGNVGNDDSASVTVEVSAVSIPVEQIVLTPDNRMLDIGASVQYVAEITPTTATDQRLDWTSSDTDVATVDQNGLATAVAAGTVTITATARDGSGVQGNASLGVNPPTILVDMITVSPANTTLEIGETQQMTADVQPGEANNRTVTWSSSNDNIAAIDANGVVTAIAGGSVNIRATANDGSGTQGTTTVTVPPANQNPNADAGEPITITLPDNAITLDGRSSTDGDGFISSYLWSQDSGGTATIATPDNFLSSVTDLEEGVYVFLLTVTDNNGGVGTDTVTVTVNPENQAPTAEAGIDQTITLPINSVDLLGMGTDNDGVIASVQWQREINGVFTTIAADAATSVSNLEEGVYTFRFEVVDDDGAIGFDTMTVTVNAAANTAPVATNDAFSVNESGTLNRSLLTNDSDEDNDDITVDRVANSSANVGLAVGGSNGGLFTINEGGNMSFDTNGDFNALNNGETQQTIVTYSITDGNGGFDTATVTITVTGVDDANQSPIVDAGEPKATTLPNDSIVLDDADALDNDGSIASYSWTKESGGAATITSPSNLVTTVTGLEEGIYIFRLTVVDDDGASSSDTVTVTVNGAPNNAPVAVNDSYSVAENDDISGVSVITNDEDMDGDPLTVNRVDGDAANVGNFIAGSNGGIFNISADGSFSFETNLEFDALNDGETAQTTITYRINDGTVSSNTATVTVTVTGVGVANQNPIADAGADDTIVLPNPLTLDGGGSDDIDGTISTYLWTKESGGAATITNPNGVSTTVTGLVEGIYVFRLTVTDDDGASASDTVTITVSAAPNQLPTVNAGLNITILVGQTAFLTATADDPDGNIVSYQWESVPPGISISNATSASASVSGLAIGTYEFSITVTDDDGATASDVVSVRVNEEPIDTGDCPDGGTNCDCCTPQGSCGSSTGDGGCVPR